MNGTHPPSTFGNYYGKLPDSKRVAIDARYSDASTHPKYEEGSIDAMLRITKSFDAIIGASKKSYYYKPRIGAAFGSENGTAEGGYIGINWLLNRNEQMNTNMGIIPTLGYEAASFGDIYSMSVSIYGKGKRGVFVSGLSGRIYSATTMNGTTIVNDLDDDIWEQDEVERKLGPVIGIEFNPYIGINVKDYLEISSGLVGGISKTGYGSNGILAYTLSITAIF